VIFDLRYPIFQAPTGSVAGPELCSAVTQAGGMGAMGLTWASSDDAVAAVRAVRDATSGLFQANFALAFEPESLSAVLDAGLPVVTFSWGDPTPYVSTVRRSAAKFGVQVTNGLGARRAVDLGADFLVCQGVEAGGHVQANRSLWDILAGVVDAAGNVPVVAAGGIADGGGIARALATGASGAMLGTRFVATVESRAHPEYKARLLESEGQTALTLCFDGGWKQSAQRVLRNSTLETWESCGSPAAGSRPGEGETIGFSASGEAILRYEEVAPRIGFSGDIEAMCLYAGAGVGVIRDLPTAAEAIERLWREAQTQE